MIHGYDPEVAIDVGVIAAVLYKNIQYWCEKNRANERHLHDGLYWTYNSVKAYSKLFPEFTEQQVRNAIKKLCEKEYIRTGNFNDDGRDRTRWFADLRPIINNIEVSKTEDCICENEQMQITELTNASDEKTEPLPNNYLQITTTNKKEVSKKVSSGNSARAKEPSFDEILDSVDVIKDNPELREAFVNFIKMRKVIKAQLTNRGLELAINRAFELAKGDPQKMIAVVNQSVERSWRGIFELTEDKVEPKTHEQLAKEAEKERAENPYYKRLEEKGVI